MEVILLERIAKLGQMGEKVRVKDGYARNFLLPRGKALRATEANKKVFESQRAQLEARNLELKKEAEGVHAKLDGKSFVMIRQAGETGQLYGSVSTRDIAEAITAGGVSVNRNQIVLMTPIKAIGMHRRAGAPARGSRRLDHAEHCAFARRGRTSGTRRGAGHARRDVDGRSWPGSRRCTGRRWRRRPLSLWAIEAFLQPARTVPRGFCVRALAPTGCSLIEFKAHYFKYVTASQQVQRQGRVCTMITAANQETDAVRYRRRRGADRRQSRQRLMLRKRLPPTPRPESQPEKKHKRNAGASSPRSRSDPPRLRNRRIPLHDAHVEQGLHGTHGRPSGGTAQGSELGEGNRTAHRRTIRRAATPPARAARSSATWSTSTRAAHGSWRWKSRPNASARNGISSATSSICLRPVKSSSSTAPGTTAPASSG